MTTNQSIGSVPQRKPVPRASRRERIGVSIQRWLDRYLSPIGVWGLRRTKGGLARPWKKDVLILTTRGRKSGRVRTVILQFFRDGEAMVITAANDGAHAHPGWYFNLTADPDVHVEVNGRTIAVHAEEIPTEEARGWWQRILLRDPTYVRYERATTRTFPIIRLVPVRMGVS